MSARILVRVQKEVFDPAAETARLTAGRTGIGAVVTFVGLCRDEDGALAALEIEHYPGMAEEEIRRVATEAAARWPVDGIIAVHRFGLIRPGETIVFIATASAHRAAAFAAASFLMDYLKTDAPFWKRQHFLGGPGDWVAARSEDEAAARKWGRQTPAATAARDDPILKRFRSAVTKIYGDRVARIVLYGSRARGGAQPDSDYDVAVFLRDMQDRFAEMDRLADLATDILYSEGEFIHAMPYRADAYEERTPLMHEIRTGGIDL